MSELTAEMSEELAAEFLRHFKEHVRKGKERRLPVWVTLKDIGGGKVSIQSGTYYASEEAEAKNV